MQKHTCKNKSFMTKRKAFTLIELLIVIAIIGILFIVLISKVDFATDKANESGVQTDFRSFQMAFDIVAKEYAGFTELINEDYEQLEAALNKNLDNKLKINIDAMGNISMANGTTDPWKVPYHGKVVVGQDGRDNGAIVIYSNGPDMQFGSSLSVIDGVATVNSISGHGTDDISLVSCYSINNGYGSVYHVISGFSNSNVNDIDDVNNSDIGDSNTNNNDSLNNLSAYGFYYDVKYCFENSFLIFHKDGSMTIYDSGDINPIVETVSAEHMSYEYKKVFLQDNLFAEVLQDGKSLQLQTGYIFAIESLTHVNINEAHQDFTENQNISVSVSLDSKKLVAVYFGNIKLSSEYYIVNDNTIVTIKKEYIESITNGQYDIKLVFDDCIATGTVSIIRNIYTTDYTDMNINDIYSIDLTSINFYEEYGVNAMPEWWDTVEILTDSWGNETLATYKPVVSGELSIMISYKDSIGAMHYHTIYITVHE